jgi:hypothetical protein
MTPTGYVTIEALHKLYNPSIDPQPALITDKKLILAKIKEGSSAFDLASEELKKNKAVRNAFIKKRFQELTSFYKDKRNDKNAMISIISTENNGVGLFFASKKLKKDPDVVLAAIQKDDTFPLKFASKKLRNSYDFMLKAVQKNPWALELASEDFRDNEDIVLAVIQQDARVLQFASKKLRNSYDFMLKAVQKNSWVLELASEDLRNNEDIVLAAMQKQPYSLQYASDELRNNYDFMLKAVQLDPWLLQYASDDLKNNKALTLAAVKKNSLARLFVIHKNFKHTQI